MKPPNDKLKIAVRQINASCLEEISADTLIRCVAGEINDTRWQAHMFSFLEELPVELIHDIVLSGFFTFRELSEAVKRWGCSDGPTTRWIEEMAALSMETVA